MTNYPCTWWQPNDPDVLVKLRSRLTEMLSKLRYLESPEIQFILDDVEEQVRLYSFNRVIMAEGLYRVDQLIDGIVELGFKFDTISIAAVIRQSCLCNWHFRLMSSIARVPTLVGSLESGRPVCFLER